MYKKRPEDIWKAKGTSLFNKDHTFEGKKWAYLKIPKGTEIPNGLLIIRDEYNKRFNAVHYSIVPNRKMTRGILKGLLDILFKNIQEKREVQVNG